MADQNKDLDKKIKKASGRNVGNNTADNQRAADELARNDKSKQQQGNYCSRQGEGGKRGNTELG